MTPLTRKLFDQIAEDGPKFAWCFDFPEPGLGQALQRLKDEFEKGSKEDPKSYGHPSRMYSAILLFVRELFIEYNVPSNEVDERFERMGMGRYWQVLGKPYYPDPEP